MSDDGLYTNDHRQQYRYSAFTAQNGCTWTSGANGADAATGGRVDLNPDQVHAKVKRSEETNPSTPGWSTQDLDLAMSRIGVPFAVRNGNDWGKVVSDHDDGLYIVLQGDSDQFGNHTCSGAFDGDHAIGIHPAEDSRHWWRIDDPICATFRYEDPAVIRRYAEKLARRIGEYPGLRFGTFTTKVPTELPDTTTGDDMYSLPESSRPYPATVDANTPVYDSATDTTPRQTINAPTKPFTVVGAGSASDTPTTGRRFIYGSYRGAPVRLGCVDVSRINAE